ncbi:MAG: hypothetical protein ACC656_05480, partial [Candidatus Heimdallarchaeota archaeon]
MIFWIALETGFIGFFGSLFIHSTRILENSIDLKKIRYFRNAGLIYIAVLEILVLFWDLMIQNRAKHLLWTENPHPTFEGKGAGLIINNNVIYSSAHVVTREI